MKRNSRMLIVIVGIVALLIAYRGVSPKAGAKVDINSRESTSLPARQWRIALVPRDTALDFWKAVRAGANKAAKDTRCSLIWKEPNLEDNPDAQSAVIDDCITKKVDAVVVAPLDNKAMVPAIQKINDARIPCVIIDSGISTDKYDSFIATDNFKGGVLAARRMAEVLQGKGKVLMVQYMAGTDSTTQRENGFVETISRQFPHITIVDKKFGQDTIETAWRAAEDLLSRNPSIDGIFACNESTTLGALRALEGMGNAGKIKLVGFDASASMIAAVRSGKIDSLVVQNPFMIGYLGVRAAVDRLNAKPVEKRIDTGVKLITRINLDTPEIQQLLNPK